VPAAAFVAVAMAVSVSAALTISRIDHGTAVDVARPTATSAYAASSGAPGR
jgi:4-hydroxy-L-threonine phosphate dehydrogenase PdxA